MNQQQPSGAQPTPVWQCSNAACRASFATPAQQCLTCGALLTGTLLSERFRIEALLGRGGMGAVYRASDLALRRQVAVKVLAPGAGLAGDDPQELRARFFREARVAAQLDHSNIVPVLHFGIDGPLAYLVMPLLAGGTLTKRIRVRQGSDPALVAGWLRQIAAALDFAHQRPQPIVHRDVKPSNLLFHEDGRLCLADFGIARVVAGSESRDSAQLTRAGVVLGSLSYMAPEQINGRAVPASDQYSAGVLLYELLTGVLPFEAQDNYALIVQHVSAAPPLPSEYVPGLPPGVDAVVMRALAKQPEDRFPTVTALADAFEQALSGAPTTRLAGRAPQARSTLPIALRPTFALGDVQQQAAFARIDDPRGDLPTQAATRLRAPVGAPSAFQGTQIMAPHQPPPAPPRRRRWPLFVFGGLAALLLCVVALAGLKALGQTARNAASATVTATAQQPSPTQTEAQHYEALLAAAEQRSTVLQDELLKKSHKPGWHVTSPGQFESEGLRLPTRVGGAGGDGGGGDGSNGATSVNATIGQILTPCDVEVDVTVTSTTVGYGFGFLSLDPPSHLLFLNAAGYYAAALIYGQKDNPTPQLLQDTDLALNPGTTYAMEIIIQDNQFLIFRDHHFIAAAPFSIQFAHSAIFALASTIDNNNPPASVTFKNLTIYPLA